MPGAQKSHTFVIQLARDHPPALVQATDEIGRRNAYVVEEDCVDVVLRKQLEGIDPDAL